VRGDGAGRTRLRARVGLALAGIVFTALAAAGCSSHPSTSQATFARDYRAASTAYREAMANLQASARTAMAAGPSAEIDVFRNILKTTDATLTRLRKLDATADVRSTYADFVDALQLQISSLQRVLDGVGRNDTTTVNQALSSYADSLQRGLALQHRLDDALQPRGP
jgi:hypothetical protein